MASDGRGSGLDKDRKVVPVESALLEPLSWRKPQRGFVNSISDLFHEDVPNDFIMRVFDVMERARHHTFQKFSRSARRGCFKCSATHRAA